MKRLALTSYLVRFAAPAFSIRLSREMMAEGVAAFASDEETPLLLPPACKSRRPMLHFAK